MGMRYLDLAIRSFVGQGDDQGPNSPAARVHSLLNELRAAGVEDSSGPFTGPSVERQKVNVRGLVAGMTLTGKTPEEVTTMHDGYRRLLTDLWWYGDLGSRRYKENSPREIHLKTSEDLQKAVTAFQGIFLRAADPNVKPQVKEGKTYSGWPTNIINPRRVQILIEWYGLNGNVVDPEEIAADVGVKAPENAYKEAMKVLGTVFRQTLKNAGLIDYEIEVEQERESREPVGTGDRKESSQRGILQVPAANGQSDGFFEFDDSDE